MQDEVEVYPHMPADTDIDTTEDTTADEDITAAYAQVPMPAPLSLPMAEAPLDAETHQDLSTSANDEEPDLQLEEIYPSQGDVPPEIPILSGIATPHALAQSPIGWT